MSTVVPGTNRHGVRLTPKCGRCRKHKQPCTYNDPTGCCVNCARDGMICGPKELAKPENNRVKDKAERLFGPPEARKLRMKYQGLSYYGNQQMARRSVWILTGPLPREKLSLCHWGILITSMPETKPQGFQNSVMLKPNFDWTKRPLQLELEAASSDDPVRPPHVNDCGTYISAAVYEMTEEYTVDTSLDFISRSLAPLRYMWTSDVDRERDRVPAGIDESTMSAVSKNLLDGFKSRFPDMDHNTIVRVVQKASDNFRDTSTGHYTPAPSDASESTAPDPVSPISSDSCLPRSSREREETRTKKRKFGFHEGQQLPFKFLRSGSAITPHLKN